QRGAHLVGFAFGVDRHAAVALLGAGVAEPGVVAAGQEIRMQAVRPGELVLLGLGFLHAQHVGILRGEPVEETLAGRGTQAVGVEADDAHGGRAGIGDWGLGIGKMQRATLLVFLLRRERRPAFGRRARLTQPIHAGRWPSPCTRYHAGMFAKPDLRVAPVKPELVEALRALRVAPGQQTFVGDTGFNLDDAMRDPNSEAMAIVVGATPVGFYRLDFAPTIVARRSIGEAGIGLRAFFLDAGW